jgi:hypothetical protein
MAILPASQVSALFQCASMQPFSKDILFLAHELGNQSYFFPAWFSLTITPLSLLTPWVLCCIIFQDVVFSGTQDRPTRCVFRWLHRIYILWISAFSASILSLFYNVSSSQLWHYFNWTKVKVKVKVKGLVSRFFGIDNRSRERPSLASPALIAGIYWAMQPREG